MQDCSIVIARDTFRTMPMKCDQSVDRKLTSSVVMLVSGEWWVVLVSGGWWVVLVDCAGEW